MAARLTRSLWRQERFTAAARGTRCTEEFAARDGRAGCSTTAGDDARLLRDLEDGAAACRLWFTPPYPVVPEMFRTAVEEQPGDRMTRASGHAGTIFVV